MANEFLNDLTAIMKTHDIEEQKITLIVRQIAQNWGGIPVYLPQIKSDMKARNAQIKNKFTGRNHTQLCREFDLSYQQICRIVNAKN